MESVEEYLWLKGSFSKEFFVVSVQYLYTHVGAFFNIETLSSPISLLINHTSSMKIYPP